MFFFMLTVNSEDRKLSKYLMMTTEDDRELASMGYLINHDFQFFSTLI